MRGVSQVSAIIDGELSGLLFALEARIVSVSGGRATVQPTARRIFPDNDGAYSYEKIENVRLMSLVWNAGSTGVSGMVKAGDECLLIAISHGDAEQPDHKNLSACVALTGFSDSSAHPMPDNVGLRLFHAAVNITLNDNNITADNGAGAKIALIDDRMVFDAPGGFEFNGKSKFNGDTETDGVSKADDHLSGEISGKGNKHKENGDGGGITDAPQQA